MDRRAFPIPEDNHNLDVRPCIAELLRTGYRPSGMILRVERVVEVALLPRRPSIHTYGRAHPTHRTYRLYLSDGELIIQALLEKTVHRFVSMGGIRTGTIICIERFEVRSAARVERRKGHVLFLAIDRLRILRDYGDFGDTDIMYAGFEFNEHQRKVETEETTPELKTPAKGSQGMIRDAMMQETDDSGAGGSGIVSIELEAAIEESQKLQDPHVQQTTQRGSGINCNIDSKAPGLAKSGTSGVPGEGAPLPSKAKVEEAAFSFSRGTLTMASETSLPFPYTNNGSRSLKPINRPLNLLTLSELVYPSRPFPKRNYLCDIFAVISWISLDTVKRPYMPLKRDLRVVDPTIAQKPSGISVSVFVDAASFNPPAGTVALFRSLKTHEWEGVSLNAYESECKDREWFITDPKRLEGYDVDGLRSWWEARLEGIKLEEEEKQEDQ